MTLYKNRISNAFSFAPSKRLALMMGIFYKAERKAFLPHIVRKSFYDVGLWPYDPEKIIRICQEHTSVDSQDKENESLRDLIDAIKIQRQRKAEWCD